MTSKKVSLVRKRKISAKKPDLAESVADSTVSPMDIKLLKRKKSKVTSESPEVPISALKQNGIADGKKTAKKKKQLLNVSTASKIQARPNKKRLKKKKISLTKSGLEIGGDLPSSSDHNRNEKSVEIAAKRSELKAVPLSKKKKVTPKKKASVS